MTPLVHTLGALQADPDSGLTYRLRFPLPTQPDKLLVLLHGVGSNEATVLGLADGVDAQTLVVLPRGPLPLGAQQFAWFRVHFTASGPSIVPEEAERSREALVRLVANLQSVHGISPQKTVVAGFSQGGIMSASVALTAPHQVAGFAVLSGRILPELEPRLASPNALAHLKAFIGHGELDSKLPVHWAHRSEQWLTALGVHPVVRLYPIDHGVSAEMHHDFLQWLASLDAIPTVMLDIGPEQTTVTVSLAQPGANQHTSITLAMGAQKTARAFFKYAIPSPLELETAIATVEDEVTRARPLIPIQSRLYTTGALARQIAVLSGVTQSAVMLLSVEAVERCFDRLTSVSLGRPAAHEGIPQDAGLVATLLILREFMHHLQFEAANVT